MTRWMLCLLVSLGPWMSAAAAGDATAGQARATVCGACHGVDGNSVVPIFPKLAGQGERYLFEQLQAIKAGTRPVPEMTGQLTPLDDQALADLAAFYASQPLGTAPGPVDPLKVAEGRALYRNGRLETGLPACAACHGPEGSGLAMAGFAQLRGQHSAYIAKQLTSLRDGSRGATRNGAIMHDIASRLDDADIAGLAAYIQTLE
jgi:cytochrome c553